MNTQEAGKRISLAANAGVRRRTLAQGSAVSAFQTDKQSVIDIPPDTPRGRSGTDKDWKGLVEQARKDAIEFGIVFEGL